MDSSVFHAFSKELLKIQDADLRELIADREGLEGYLPGGQLPSNALADEGGQYAIKLGSHGNEFNFGHGWRAGKNFSWKGGWRAATGKTFGAEGKPFGAGILARKAAVPASVAIGAAGTGLALRHAMKDDEQEKTANRYGSDPIGLAAGLYDLPENKKRKKIYQPIRDYALTGMKGGLQGLGVLGASRALRGLGGSQPSLKRLRQFAAGGALISMADKAYDDRATKSEKTAMVTPSPTRPFVSPSTAFDAARKTGGFKSTIVRNLGKPPKLVELGKKFITR